jgi:hypothetical protein
MKPDTFHHTNDGRGLRRVYVNGLEVGMGGEIFGLCIWADTRKGLVQWAPLPTRIKKPEGDEVYTRLLRGHVTVEFVDERPVP